MLINKLVTVVLCGYTAMPCRRTIAPSSQSDLRNLHPRAFQGSHPRVNGVNRYRQIWTTYAALVHARPSAIVGVFQPIIIVQVLFDDTYEYCR